MLTLPEEFMNVIVTFAPLFTQPVWTHVQVLLTGAILTPRKRTVSSCLRVMGLGEERHFGNYHRVLNRVRWSGLAASQRLLGLIVTAFAPQGELVCGLDDTIERRRGDRIAAKGIYRDPVRSSHSHFVKASGLRWLCLMALVRIPWADRVWALPFLTVLCPSERYHQERGRKHQKLTDRARQLLRLVARWLPERQVVVVADSSFAALELLHAVAAKVTVVTRLRLDAALYEPARPRQPGQKGRPQLKGKRLPILAQVATNPATEWTSLTLSRWYNRRNREVEITTGTAVWYHTGKPVVPIRWVLVRDPKGEFEPQAFLSTKLATSPAQVLAWFVQRWQVEVTFAETRAHLGVETQRQWSQPAIARTTPALMALFSIVTLTAHAMQHQTPIPVERSAWYTKALPTFSDALAVVRSRLWWEAHFSMSLESKEMEKVPISLLKRLADTLCFAA
ncbi:MAG TPA: transposase [Acidobacteriota bacterium]|nr:transposase [Acidobacteriota bacterium]